MTPGVLDLMLRDHYRKTYHINMDKYRTMYVRFTDPEFGYVCYEVQYFCDDTKAMIEIDVHVKGNEISMLQHKLY